jgi:uncharacterized delta-60 repeat protein
MRKPGPSAAGDAKWRQVRRIAVVALLISAGLAGAPATAVSAQCDLDLSLGGAGIVRGLVADTADGVAVQPDGKIVTAGVLSRYLTVSRFNPDGSPDTGFGPSGNGTAFFTRDGIDYVEGKDVALQPDGKILVAGRVFAGVSGSSLYDGLVLRVNPDGTLDTGFGAAGWAMLDVGGNQDSAQALALQPDGSIVIGGDSRSATGNADLLAARFLPSGTLDASFGRGGVVQLDLRSDFDSAFDIALQSDGKVVLAGSYQPSVMTSVLVRLTTTGARDRAFGRRGIVVGSSGAWYAVDPLPDGRLLAGGEQSAELTVGRYLADGRLDSSFAGDGTASAGGDGSLGRAFGLAPRADGGLLAVGSIGQYDMLAASFDQAGAPDSSFGLGGVFVYHDPDGWNSELLDVTRDGQGRAVTAGLIGYDEAIARFACG